MEGIARIVGHIISRCKLDQVHIFRNRRDTVLISDLLVTTVGFPLDSSSAGPAVDRHVRQETGLQGELPKLEIGGGLLPVDEGLLGLGPTQGHEFHCLEHGAVD